MDNNNIKEIEFDINSLLIISCDKLNFQKTYNKNNVLRFFYKSKNNVNNKYDLFSNFVTNDTFTELIVFREFVNITRQNVLQLITKIITPTEFLIRAELRKLFNLLIALLQNFNLCPNDELDEYFTLISKLNNLFRKISYTIFNYENIEESTDTVEWNHFYLEFRCLYLISLYKYYLMDIKKVNVFLENLELFIKDLIAVSLNEFNKLHISEITNHNPFICNCFKEYWLFLQYFIELSNDNLVNSFWHYFNKSMQIIEPYSKAINNENIEVKSIKLKCKNELIFYSWMVSYVGKLYGYDENGTFVGHTCKRIIPNYELIDDLLIKFINDKIIEKDLRLFLLIINNLIVYWWPMKSDIIIKLWEYYQKNLNNNFYILESSLGSMAVSSNSCNGYIEKMEKLIFNNDNNIFNITFNNSNSFELFLYIIGKHLLLFQELQQYNLIQKIIGRIFSKFTPNKMVNLTEIGIHNIIILFITLSLTYNITKIEKNVQNLLLKVNINHCNNIDKNLIIIKGHLSIILLMKKSNSNLKGYFENLLVHFVNLNNLSLYNLIIDFLNDLLLSNEDCDYNCDEHLIIDSWLLNYFRLCKNNEQFKLYKILIKIVKVIIHKEVQTLSKNNLIDRINKFILPTIKINYAAVSECNNSFILTDEDKVLIGELSAYLCMCRNRENELLHYFINNNCNSYTTALSFAMSILMNNKYCTNESVILQMWIKCCILTPSHNKELKHLTSLIINNKEFLEFYKSDHNIILTAKEPFFLFLKEAGKTYQNKTDFKEKILLIEKMCKYFLPFELWINNLIENDNYIYTIYNVIGIIILYCSQLVYIRSKPACFFNVVIAQYILPCHLLMGKNPTISVIKAIHNIWDKLLIGICKLDYTNDNYICKIINDLIIKWLPHFKILTNPKLIARPYINLINSSQENDTYIDCFYEKFTNQFINLQSRQPHAHSCLAITIINEIILNIIDNEVKLKLLLKYTLYNLIEHLMLCDENVPSKSLIISLLNNLFQTLTYRGSTEIKDIFVMELKRITSKHLSCYSSYYFQFLNTLLKINPLLIKEILPHLSNEIKNVEYLRGVENDNRLRNSFANLEGALLARITTKLQTSAKCKTEK